MNNLKISIPAPCHEDWNKMTPNEKGSFCGSCCKTVIDFSNKTSEEIRETLLAQSGKKVCGRFKNEQLAPPAEQVGINIPSYLLPKNISLQKAFAIALFFVFGTSLFSCRTTEDHLVGEIAIVENVDTPRVNVPPLIADTNQLPPEIIMGTVAVPPPECHTQGEVEMVAPVDTLKQEIKMGKVKYDE